MAAYAPGAGLDRSSRTTCSSKSYNVKTVTKVNSQCGMPHFFNKTPLSVSGRAPDRTISVCPDSAAALTSAPRRCFCPVGWRIQAGLGPELLVRPPQGENDI